MVVVLQDRLLRTLIDITRDVWRVLLHKFVSKEELCALSTISDLSGALLSVIADIGDFSGTLLSITTEMDTSLLVSMHDVIVSTIIYNFSRIWSTSNIFSTIIYAFHIHEL